MHKTSIIALIAAFGLLSTAAPADAIYIETPLVLEGQDHADVGDDIDLTAGPNQNNESAKDDWAGKTVKVRYSYDKNENHQGGADAPTSNEGYTEGDIGTITLDAKAAGTIRWTVPAAVDDRNVHIFLEDDAGERVAFTFVGIGDAEPMMRLASSSGPMDGEPELGDASSSGDIEEEAGEASALGLVSVLALGALALVGVARRR